MSREKLSMRKVSEVARLSASGLSNRQIARSCNLARSTVAEYLERFEGAGLKWPLPPEMSEEELMSDSFSGRKRAGAIRLVRCRSGRRYTRNCNAEP